MEIFIFVAIICGIVTAIIASSKGRNAFGWFFVGLLLGIFGIILIACLPATPERESARVLNPMDELGKAKQLWDSGAISESEYNSIKSRLVARSTR